MLTGGALLAAVTFAVIHGGHAGIDPAAIVATSAALALLPAFWWAERRAADPMLDLRLFQRPDFTAANAVAATMNLVSLRLIFVLTLYLQRVQGRSALGAGIAVLPLFAPLGALAPLAGRLTARVGARRPMTIGLLGGAAGVALLSVVHAHSGDPTLLPTMLLWCAGLGVLTPAVVAAAVGAVPSDRAGLASAVNNTARQAGGVIGIAAFGALAGPPRSQHLLAGFQTTGLIGAALFAAAAVATLAFIPAGHPIASGPIGVGDDFGGRRRSWSA